MSKIKLNCNFCNKEVLKYPSEIRGQNIYCDHKCYKEFNRSKRETRGCHECGAEVTRSKGNFSGVNTFCSRECVNAWQSVNFTGEGHPFYGKKQSAEEVERNRQWQIKFGPKGKKHPRYSRVEVECDTCGELTLKTQYLIDRGVYDYCSDECRHVGQRDAVSGTKNPNYNPDLTPEDRNRNRTSNLGYTRFKNEVLRRDNNTCSYCGSVENMVVHHLNSHHWDKENRVNPDNGRVLCRSCHRTFHREYGYKYNTKEQFREFISTKNKPNKKQLTLF